MSHPVMSPPGMLDFPCDVERLANGNTLISDAGAATGEGSEIIEVDPLGQVVWRFDQGLHFAHSAKRLGNGNTLITDTNHNRVIEVSPARAIVFSTDDWNDGSGRLSDGSHLHYPNDAHALEDGSLIITDRNNNRFVIVDRQGRVIRQFSQDIHHPHNCDILPNGHVLLADSDGRRIMEVDAAGQIVWSYGDGSPTMMQWPRDADRLDNGNTLITDSRGSRIFEVDPTGKIVWEYKAPYHANFYEADKLPSGNILASSQQHQQVVEIDPAGNIIWQFRNHVVLRPIHPKLVNGSFRQRDAQGNPVGWQLFTRVAEGGGKLIWDESHQPYPCPGLEYDRAGALYLEQTVVAKPNRHYQLAGKLKTELAQGSTAYFQLAWMDEMGGYTANTSDLPKGQMFTGTNPWTQDSLEVVSPANATAMEVRILITGKGRLWAQGIMVFS